MSERSWGMNLALEEDRENFDEPMGAPGTGGEGIPGQMEWKQEGSGHVP